MAVSRNRAATLKEVAALAGVSTATVARVLHGKGYVSAESRKSVQSAIDVTGYQLNAVAQGLRTRRTLVLGHVLLSISSNPFFAGVAKGVEEEAAKNGCGVLTVAASEDADTEHDAVENLIRRRVDAILFTTAHHESTIRLARSARIPVVQVERAGVPDTHAVTIDNYHGASRAVEHLMSLGHRRIAFIGVAPSLKGENPFAMRRQAVERERFEGYCNALDAQGIFQDSLVELGRSYTDLTFAREAASRLLASTSPPTAIFAACDFLAAGVLQELYALGLRVPADISLVGFDDVLATHLAPPLTTVAQPMLDIGREAAALAIREVTMQSAATPETGAYQTIRLQTHLVVRDSTGPMMIP